MAAMNRRELLTAAGVAATAPVLPGAPVRAADAAKTTPAKFKLGTISYNIGATWDLATLLRACRAAGFEMVELRTGHAHKVEPTLTAVERRDVKKQVADSGVTLWGLGSTCEFHAADAAEVKKNIENCRAFCKLAADVGARGVKVRPNGFPKGVPEARTLEQIGRALRECGKAAADAGVEIWLEVHGPGTQSPPNIRAIIDHCGHKSVGVCWNSNPTDVKDGSIAESFALLKKDIRSCHINELTSGYPYKELFAGLRGIGYDRVTLMELAGVPEAADAREPAAALRFMRYYKALWTELVG